LIVDTASSAGYSFWVLMVQQRIESYGERFTAF
jgi:hypothetical protein